MKSTSPLEKLAVLCLFCALLGAGPATQDLSETANPKASPDAQAIMKYLRSLPFRPAKKLISGQFECQWGRWGPAVAPLSNPNNALTIVHEKTGQWVGLVGVSYHSPRGLHDVAPDAPNRLCVEYWRKGGLVQIYLAMRNPASPKSINGSGHCNIDWVLDPKGKFHRFFFHELDEVATGLDELQKQGVVVILNPFAEANAGWFWWCGQNPQEFKALYRATFDYLVHTKHLNNLLFVFEVKGGRQAAVRYPGDSYVDVIGISLFTSWKHELTAADLEGYPSLTALGKPLAISQWGPRHGMDQGGENQPPADNMKLLRAVQKDFPLITWWMNWGAAYALSSQANSNYNDKKLLDQPRVINLDDLAWKSSRSNPSQR